MRNAALTRLVAEKRGGTGGGDFPPSGGSQHRICLDTGFRRRPAKRKCGALPHTPQNRRKNEQGHHIQHSDRVQRFGYHQKESETGRLSQSDYVTRCCLGRQVVVIEDLKETAKQLRAIGSNLNRLTTLANMGRISVTGLDAAAQELAGVSAALREIQERGRWNR